MNSMLIGESIYKKERRYAPRTPPSNSERFSIVTYTIILSIVVREFVNTYSLVVAELA